MTFEDQGAESAEPVVETTPTQGQEAEQETVETEEAQQPDGEVEATEVEPVEVDYREVAEKLEKDVSGRQAKIDKQRAALAQSNQKIQELQAQLQSIQSVEAPSEPVIDDYETHDEYVNALADFRAEQRVKETQTKFMEEQKQQLEQQRMAQEREEFAKQEHEFRSNVPTYDNSKSELQSHMQAFPPNPAVADAVYEQAKNGGNLAQIIDYFGANGGENLSEFDRIVSLSPVQAAVEIFKIQQQLGAAGIPKKQAKPAPKPVKVERASSNRSKPISKKSGSEILDWVKS